MDPTYGEHLPRSCYRAQWCIPRCWLCWQQQLPSGTGLTGRRCPLTCHLGGEIPVLDSSRGPSPRCAPGVSPVLPGCGRPQSALSVPETPTPWQQSAAARAQPTSGRSRRSGTRAAASRSPHSMATSGPWQNLALQGKKRIGLTQCFWGADGHLVLDYGSEFILWAVLMWHRLPGDICQAAERLQTLKFTEVFALMSLISVVPCAGPFRRQEG